MKIALILATLAISGCTTTTFTPATGGGESGAVRVLYEYPQSGEYKSLGTIEAYHYQPGFSAPRVADAMPKLKQQAEAAGGNALIVRSQQVGQFDRSITVTAEVLRIESGQ